MDTWRNALMGCIARVEAFKVVVHIMEATGDHCIHISGTFPELLLGL